MCSAIHLADTAAVEIAHGEEGVVLVPEIVPDAERDGVRVSGAAVVEPCGSLNIVLAGRGRNGAGVRVGTKPIEQIVRGTIFLHDDDDVLESCARLGGPRQAERGKCKEK